MVALSPQGIYRHLRGGHAFRVEVRGRVASTNDAVAEMARAGAPEGLVVAADAQSAGRGSQGRRYYSPEGAGAYFSVLLRPADSIARPQLITAAAAAAVAETLEEHTRADIGIKWVNDVFCNGKKVCGILTEGTLDAASGRLAHAVLGIGVNIATPPGGYPGWLGGEAGAVFDDANYPDDIRNTIVAGILNRFAAYYSDIDSRGFLRVYREKSIVVGRQVAVTSGGRTRRARAEGIDDECRLIVRYAGGETEALAGGRISIEKAD
ncbi:MAG: biotin--[acetyl-CoA-carboxylase] ligase [Oscillospiraceae bacterium]|jgi:BirA family biotin operon repressor/biotin-[acetyl-CoA-carboxylase] ligase|nr:biotin--[acetyl-CoA-carboxylase] ligase [Oscillospiraceae bacterium]